MQFKVNPETEQVAKMVEAAFLKAGGEQKHGIAPRGPRDRKVAEMLESVCVRTQDWE